MGKLGHSGSEDVGMEMTSPSRLEDTLPTFQQPKRYVKPEDKRESKAAPGVLIMGAGDNRCQLCNKRVYEMEKMISDKAIYHKMCFKCSHCKRILSLGNFASMEGQLYCKPHFIEMFKTKGNYEEGFGKERHSRMWLKDPSPEEPEDKVDDGLDTVQSIHNIKTRFMGRDDKVPMPGETVHRGTRSGVSPTNGHVNGSRSSPEVVNRAEDEKEILERELPPVNMARSVASKFRDMESDQGDIERKPVRRMTPPREDLAQSISSMDRDIERNPDIIRSGEEINKEEELPPPSFTKNMLAKFKSMEDVAQPPPSPGRSSTSPTKRITTPSGYRTITSHSASKASPDEGIADTEPSVNGHGRSEETSEVVRESDKTEVEELPERGFTKSLLAQWRQIEQVSTSSPAKSPSASRRGPQVRPSPANSQGSYSSLPDDLGTPREVVRASDTNEEEYLPPPSYTKNMLAKFKNMQEEAASKDSAVTPGKKGPVLKYTTEDSTNE